MVMCVWVGGVAVQGGGLSLVVEGGSRGKVVRTGAGAAAHGR